MTELKEPDPPKLRRLLKRAEFLHVARGLSAARGAVVVQASPLAEPVAHIGVGFTATRKIGGAVVRNRAKRRLREAARVLLPLHGRPGVHYVFVARAGTPSRPWERLLDDVTQALQALREGGDKARPRPRAPRKTGPEPLPWIKRTRATRSPSWVIALGVLLAYQVFVLGPGGAQARGRQPRQDRPPPRCSSSPSLPRPGRPCSSAASRRSPRAPACPSTRPR